MLSTLLLIGLGFLLNMIYRSLKIKNLPEEPSSTAEKQTHYGKNKSKLYEKNKIYYYHLGKWPQIASPSPFCLKLETYLKINKIDYKSVVNPQKKTPSKKWPFIVHNSKLIEDSDKCIEYIAKEYNVDIDDNLTAEQILKGKLMKKMLEKCTYFWLLYIRWYDEANFKDVRKNSFGKLPPPLAKIIGHVVRKGIVDSLYYQGAGRYAKADILNNLKDDIECCVELLGKNKFILGDKISSYDATFYGFLAQGLVEVPHNYFKELVLKYPTVVKYVDNMRKTYYPDSYDFIKGSKKDD